MRLNVKTLDSESDIVATIPPYWPANEYFRMPKRGFGSGPNGIAFEPVAMDMRASYNS